MKELEIFYNDMIVDPSSLENLQVASATASNCLNVVTNMITARDYLAREKCITSKFHAVFNKDNELFDAIGIVPSDLIGKSDERQVEACMQNLGSMIWKWIIAAWNWLVEQIVLLIKFLAGYPKRGDSIMTLIRKYKIWWKRYRASKEDPNADLPIPSGYIVKNVVPFNQLNYRQKLVTDLILELNAIISQIKSAGTNSYASMIDTRLIKIIKEADPMNRGGVSIGEAGLNFKDIPKEDVDVADPVKGCQNSSKLAALLTAIEKNLSSCQLCKASAEDMVRIAKGELDKLTRNGCEVEIRDLQEVFLKDMQYLSKIITSVVNEVTRLNDSAYLFAKEMTNAISKMKIMIPDERAEEIEKLREELKSY